MISLVGHTAPERGLDATSSMARAARGSFLRMAAGGSIRVTPEEERSQSACKNLEQNVNDFDQVVVLRMEHLT